MVLSRRAFCSLGIDLLVTHGAPSAFALCCRDAVVSIQCFLPSQVALGRTAQLAAVGTIIWQCATSGGKQSLLTGGTCAMPLD